MVGNSYYIDLNWKLETGNWISFSNLSGIFRLPDDFEYRILPLRFDEPKNFYPELNFCLSEVDKKECVTFLLLLSVYPKCEYDFFAHNRNLTFNQFPCSRKIMIMSKIKI